MKNILFTLIFLAVTLTSQQAMARDEILEFSIRDAIFNDKARKRLGKNVKFYFGERKPKGQVEKRIIVVNTSKKTNAFGKSDKEACEWAFLSAMIELRDQAKKHGGNAVIEIKSNYKNNLTSSESTFRCGAGAVVAGTALKGLVVKLK